MPQEPPVARTNTLVTRYRWTICALLFAATTINYIDRQILSLIKPILDQQLGWTNEEFGLVNSAFQGAYAVGLLFFGWFVDRFGEKIGYSVSIIAWSISAIGHSLVSSVAGFFTARTALGLGESGNFPSAIKAAATWFPQRERAFATTLLNAGTNVGPIVAPAIVPWIALTWGWQAAFIAAGVAGLLWLLLWIPFYTQPEKNKHVSPGELALILSDRPDVSTGPKPSWIQLLKYRQTWSFIVAKFITDPVWWFFLIWLPDYFKKTRGLAIQESWIHLVTIYTIITALSLIGGWLTGHLAERGWSVTRARKTGFFIFALCFLPIFFVTSVEDWPAVFLIGLAGAAHQAWSANLFTTVSDMFPKYAVGSVVGIGGMAGAIGGMLFPVFCGRLLDIFTAQGNVTGGYAVLFTICAFAYLVAFSIHHLLAPKFEKFEMK
jgi:ACS family hexuronate transporter-like MFS transporter